ncbi:MAG: hypothetical protein WCK77_20485 [Verrucomicrobiota bacterium]
MRLNTTTVDGARYTAEEIALEASPGEHLCNARMLRILADNIFRQVAAHEAAAKAAAAALVQGVEVKP